MSEEPPTDPNGPAETPSSERKFLSVRQAAFIGVGATNAGLSGAVFVTFVFTTLIHEPPSVATLAGILVLSVALDYGWKHFRGTRTKNVQLAH